MTAGRLGTHAGHGEPTRRGGDRLIVVGVVIFTAGVLGVLLGLVPLFLGSERMPAYVYAVAMLAPVGLALGLLGLGRESRDRRH